MFEKEERERERESEVFVVRVFCPAVGVFTETTGVGF